MPATRAPRTVTRRRLLIARLCGAGPIGFAIAPRPTRTIILAAQTAKILPRAIARRLAIIMARAVRLAEAARRMCSTLVAARIGPWRAVLVSIRRPIRPAEILAFAFCGGRRVITASTIRLAEGARATRSIISRAGGTFFSIAELVEGIRGGRVGFHRRATLRERRRESKRKAAV
jgi:hypothetical protein